MANLYHTLYTIWRLDISTWQVHEAHDPHNIADMERRYAR